RHLVRELARQLRVYTWGQLRHWLDTRPPAKKAKIQFPLNRERRLSLPDRPGVYRYRRIDGSLLYVGKATSLKKRVNSYFRARNHPRTLEMLTQARALDVTETATALEAAVLETDLIKDERPPYNVQLQRQERAAWFATSDLRRLAEQPDSEFRIGPLPSRHCLLSFEALVECLEDGSASPRRRALAMSERAGFAGPSPEEFVAGVQLFIRRYPQLNLHWGWSRALLQLGKTLAELAARGKLDPGPKGVGHLERPWDPPRVARHLERVALQTGQVLRRARWLMLLSEATLAWHEGAVRRELVLVEGVIQARSNTMPERELAVPPGFSRPVAERRQNLASIGAYDRLRVISTEVKRLVEASDDVAVRLGPNPALTGAALRRLVMLT
ncbi:MAG: nucleotide excision repair endonuclease, partial [Myxococcota bacterium]